MFPLCRKDKLLGHLRESSLGPLKPAPKHLHCPSIVGPGSCQVAQVSPWTLCSSREKDKRKFNDLLTQAIRLGREFLLKKPSHRPNHKVFDCRNKVLRAELHQLTEMSQEVGRSYRSRKWFIWINQDFIQATEIANNLETVLKFLRIALKCYLRSQPLILEQWFVFTTHFTALGPAAPAWTSSPCQ